MFATGLCGHISANQMERQKFLVIYLVLGIILISLFWIFRDKISTPLVFLASFMVFGSAAPQLIARFINLRHAKVRKQILEFRTSTPDTMAEVFGVIFMVLFTLVFIIPSIADTVDNAPIYDFALIYAEIGLLIVGISYITLFSMNIVQKTYFYSDGLFYKGLFWEWSNFQAYSWESHPKKKNVQVILLTTAKSVWNKQIKLFVPHESKEQINLHLAQKLERRNESA